MSADSEERTYLRLVLVVEEDLEDLAANVIRQFLHVSVCVAHRTHLSVARRRDRLAVRSISEA